MNGPVTINGLVTLTPLLSPECEAGPLPPLRATATSKGVTVRQALAGIALRTFLSFKSTLVLLLALAVGGAAVAPSHANSKYAAIVVDANTGKTLFSSSADAARYPASLTKMMTLYLTFEALQSGKISKTRKVTFSKNAAAEPPTKLGVKAGGSVTVETAILSLVTKSANDSATALGELLGGSEENFARHDDGQGAPARHDRHDLPQRQRPAEPAQHSTARDMATLGIALREHFPQYYSYFSTRSFKYGKQRLANHNRLLGRVKGVDGIKTGYTRASGFNLVSSVSDGNRRIVAVVMGGQSAEVARQPHGRADPHLAAEGFGQARRRRSRRQGQRRIRQFADPCARRASCPARTRRNPDARPEEDVMALAETKRLPKPRRSSCDRYGGRRRRRAPIAEPVVEQAYAEPIPARMADIDPINTASVPKSGWSIQVASSPSEVEARAFLPRPPGRRARRWPMPRRLHRHLRQGRRDLLPRPLRRLRDRRTTPGTPARR